MKTSAYWITHFKANALKHRINWALAPAITPAETGIILSGLQAWQLGETSDGRHLIAASEKYAVKINDPGYLEAVKLFIKEEQKHGNNLGRYLDAIGKPRVKQNWGDTLFRAVRYFNTNAELWTLTVLIVESTAQLFYQSLKDATGCTLLKQVCSDILIDEAYHITFQTERLGLLFETKSNFSRSWRKTAYKYFFWFTVTLVWFGYRKVFRAGGNCLSAYTKRMEHKYWKTIGAITQSNSITIAHSLK